MQTTKRVVLLTGSNRGLGKRTAEILLEKYAEQFFFIFTQRASDHQQLTIHFQNINKNAQFSIQQLDVADSQSRANFISWLSSTHKAVDVIFNNAGVYDKSTDKGQRPSQELTQFTLGVNFFSTVEFTEELYPLLTDDGKIIIISSMLGKLSIQPEEAQKLLNDQTLTKERIFQFGQNYINSSSDPTKDLIFNNFVYHTSKALLNTYIRFVATKYIKQNQSVFSVHPGWVQTDMGGKDATMTQDEACPFLANIVGEFPFGRHPLSGLLQFKNADFGY